MSEVGTRIRGDDMTQEQTEQLIRELERIATALERLVMSEEDYICTKPGEEPLVVIAAEHITKRRDREA